jgi:hypothetical protein
MRHLRDSKDYALSCGIVLLTGFPTGRISKDVYSNVLADLKDCDGYVNEYKKRSSQWTDAGYVVGERTYHTEKAAFVLVSLNAGQCKIWRIPLIEAGFREVVQPKINPNSGRKITIFIRERAPKVKPRKKKKEKKV